VIDEIILNKACTVVNIFYHLIQPEHRQSIKEDKNDNEGQKNKIHEII